MVGHGRNDPCPCGSGRKHKHCCLGREPTALERSAALRRDVSEVAAREGTWELEALPLVISIEERAARRPVALLVVAGGFVVRADIQGRLAGGAGAVAVALERALAAAAKDVACYPDCVQVRHADVAAALAPLLKPKQIEVHAVDPLPGLEEAARSLTEKMTGHATWPPVAQCETWAGWELPRQLTARLFGAAAAFWRQAPWRLAANLQAPRCLLPSGREWTACVLGNAGEEYGLALYSVADDLFIHAVDAAPDEPFATIRGRIILLSFSKASELPAEMVGEVRFARWEVASPVAYPALLTVNTPGGGVSRDEVEDLILLLDATPAFVAKHRHALMAEERTREPCEPIEWTHGPTGVVFRYAGKATLMDELEDDEAVTHPVVREEFAATLREVSEELGPDADESEFIEAVRARLSTRTSAYNRAPQQELGGLSPVQVQRLLDADWEGADGAVQLCRDLELPALGGADLFANARILLAYADEHGLGATQAGNIKVADVRALVDRLRLEPGYLERHFEISSRLIEGDVRPLHEVRVLSEIAGLLHRRGTRFELTTTGTRLLDDSRAGELYAQFFTTCLRRFNIAYGSRLEWPELQHQAAFTLYRLTQAGTAWHTADQLLVDAVLPYAIERAPRIDIMDFPPMLLEHHLLRRLVQFGLLDCQPRTARHTVHMNRRFRATRLLTDFVQFSL